MGGTLIVETGEEGGETVNIRVVPRARVLGRNLRCRLEVQ